MEKITKSMREEMMKEKLLNEIIEQLTQDGRDVFRTKDMSTITFPLNMEDGSERYYSLKLTLHKPTYDLDKSIEEFEEIYEEKQIKLKLREEKLKKQEKEIARKAAQEQAKKNIAAKAKAKRDAADKEVKDE